MKIKGTDSLIFMYIFKTPKQYCFLMIPDENIKNREHMQIHCGGCPCRVQGEQDCENWLNKEFDLHHSMLCLKKGDITPG